MVRITKEMPKNLCRENHKSQFTVNPGNIRKQLWKREIFNDAIRIRENRKDEYPGRFVSHARFLSGQTNKPTYGHTFSFTQSQEFGSPRYSTAAKFTLSVHQSWTNPVSIISTNCSFTPKQGLMLTKNYYIGHKKCNNITLTYHNSACDELILKTKKTSKTISNMQNNGASPIFLGQFV